MHVLLKAALAAVAATGGSAVAAKENLPPHACIVQRTDRIARVELLDLVKGGFAPTTNAGKTTMTVVGEVIASCRSRHGWSKARQDLAIRYFSARLLHDDAIEKGSKFALTDAILLGYVASRDAATRDSYAKGQVTPEMNRAAFAYLQTAGIVLEGRPVEDVQAVGQALNSGVYAIIVEQDAVKAYTGS
jgi:hypothetical protein